MEAIFERTVGQDLSRENIAATLKKGAMPHATLIYGAKGLGQNALALDLAAQIVCQDKNSRPCRKCAPCLELLHQSGNAVHYIFPLPEPNQKKKEQRIEAAAGRIEQVYENPYSYYPGPTENISEAQIRDLKEGLSYSSAGGKSRVVILFFPEKMGPASAKNPSRLDVPDWADATMKKVDKI